MGSDQEQISPTAIFFLDMMKINGYVGGVMIVQFDPDTCWGIKPRESEVLSIIVRASSVAGALVPRPQAGRGLFGVIMLLNELSHSFRRRLDGEKERTKPWTITITNGTAVNRRGGIVYSYASFSLRDWLHGFFASSVEVDLVKRRPLLVGVFS